MLLNVELQRNKVAGNCTESVWTSDWKAYQRNSTQADFGRGGKLNIYLMARCLINIRTKIIKIW